MIENFKLHVFRVVADTLNFSKAAEELHTSQSGVTSQVRSLEERLGIALSEDHRSIGGIDADFYNLRHRFGLGDLGDGGSGAEQYG
jgi:hypothetical protein